MQDCLFCKIVKGEIPCRKVHEDESTIAFLDINPANPGHTLIVPKTHHENIYETADDDLKKLIIVAKRIARLAKERLSAHGVNIVQNNDKHAGQLVSHIHFHVIPRFENDMVVISYKRAPLSDKDLDEVQQKMTAKPESKEPTKKYNDALKEWEMEL